MNYSLNTFVLNKPKCTFIYSKTIMNRIYFCSFLSGVLLRTRQVSFSIPLLAFTGTGFVLRVHRNFFITNTKSKRYEFGNCQGSKYGSYKVNREGERHQVESNASREREGQMRKIFGGGGGIKAAGVCGLSFIQVISYN